MVKLWCLGRSSCISAVEANCYGETKNSSSSRRKSGRKNGNSIMSQCDDREIKQMNDGNASDFGCEDTMRGSLTHPVALSSVGSSSSSHTSASAAALIEQYNDEEGDEERMDDDQKSCCSGGVDYSIDHGYENHAPDRRRRYSFGKRGSNKCGGIPLSRRRSSQYSLGQSNNNNHHHDELEEDLRYGYSSGGGNDCSNIPNFGTVLGSSSIRRNTPRRSSLKHKGAPRRASIGYTGEMTLILPTGEEKRKRSSITFANETDLNQTREVQPIRDMIGSGNVNRLWFQEEEYDHIKKEIVRIVRQSSTRNLMKHDVTTREPETWVETRGLENLGTDRRRYCNNIRQEAKNGVIEEYMLQKANGRYDEEAIRQMYTFHTIDCKIEAAERGAQDALFVQNYLKDSQVSSSSANHYNRRRSC